VGRSETDVVESVIDWPHGAKSICFRDPDGHLAELIPPGFWAIYCPANPGIRPDGAIPGESVFPATEKG
jgi:hypothetical protein